MVRAKLGTRSIATILVRSHSPQVYGFLRVPPNFTFDIIFLINNVVIGKGKLAGKGVYANLDFKEGELVKLYNLKPLTQSEYDALPKNQRMFTHSFWGQIYLFPEPSRYTNHSPNPNTRSDLKKMCDYAIKPIKKGEMITTNATVEVHNEVETFLEVYEKNPINDFNWLKGGYSNAVVSYRVGNKAYVITLKRAGNWQIVRKEVQ